MIEKVLEEKQHPEQAFKVCMGIINLSKKFGDERLNNACSKALMYGFHSYKRVKEILDKGVDKKEPEEQLLIPLPNHENTRGSNYFTEEKT